MIRNKKTVLATIVFVAVFAIAVVIVCSATGVFDKDDHNTWYEGYCQVYFANSFLIK